MVMSTVNARSRERHGGFGRKQTFYLATVNVWLWVACCRKFVEKFGSKLPDRFWDYAGWPGMAGIG